MNAKQELEVHLSTRLESLKKEKEKGRKIIGYIPTGYFPEELVLAFDAIPLGFIFAGNPSVLTASMEYVSKWFGPVFSIPNILLPGRRTANTTTLSITL